MGMNTLSDGTRLEGVMMKANPNLLMYLYFNGTRAEKAYWSPFFPPSWYLTTEPDHFGLELMNLHSDAIFAAPDTLKGAPARAGFTAHGWNDWVAKYSNWVLRRGPEGRGGLGRGEAFYVGIYLDNVIDPISYGLMDHWRRVNHSSGWLITIGLVQGSWYFGSLQGTRVWLGHQSMANMEMWLNSQAPTGAVMPNEKRWLADVSAIIDAQQRAPISLMTKVYDPRLIKAEVDDWRELAVASYLISVRKRLWMSFLPFGDPPWGRPDASVPWQANWRYWTESTEPIYAANLGDSTDRADTAASNDGTANAAVHYKRNGVWMQRTFAHGVSIVNPTDQDAVIQLDRTTDTRGTVARHIQPL